MSDAHTVLIKGLLTAVLGLVAYGARADASAEVDRVMAIGCRIEVKADGEAIRIDAIARSREDLNGRYRFDIQKISASGTSHNIQSGNFSLEADREEILSTTFLGASDANRYQAKLVLDSSSGSISCVSP
jgi:curli production assembly/transport CsgH protein